MLIYNPNPNRRREVTSIEAAKENFSKFDEKKQD